MTLPPKTATATFCATMCDQLWVDGLTHAFIAPGSRSTPLALALLAHDGIHVELFHDERSAAFAALGVGLATGLPALVLCTSGTAAAHFFAAVIEADASAVPLIVCTADRPPELWGRGAPQTIDQTAIYGNKVRSFIEPGPPDDTDPSTWRSIVRGMWVEATGTQPGPVHANLSFRDPLTGHPGELPAPLAPLLASDSTEVDNALVQEVANRLVGRRGVIIAGRHDSDAGAITGLAQQLGWPILADHRSGCRDLQHFDALLRSADFATNHVPDVVVRIGEIVSSKAVSQWLTAVAAGGTEIISGRPHGRHIDPENIATVQFDERGFIEALLATVTGSEGAPNNWLASWREADRSAAEVIASIIESEPLSEVQIARAVSATSGLRSGALVVSSSMPVRDLEWYGSNTSNPSVYANRGANGIDGVIATAIGIALTGVPTTCMIGDVAFLHDASSLIALRNRPIDLTIVVIDNDGGGIFSFLPQHELLPTADYEMLFGTPHGTDLAALTAAHGLTCEPFEAASALVEGVRVVIATTNRTANLDLHNRINAAVAHTLADVDGDAPL